jgi:hypothetical protein
MKTSKEQNKITILNSRKHIITFIQKTNPVNIQFKAYHSIISLKQNTATTNN